MIPVKCLWQTAVFYESCWVVAIVYCLGSGLGGNASARRALSALASSLASEICVSADCSRMNSRLFAYLNGESQIEEMRGGGNALSERFWDWGGSGRVLSFSETVLSHRNGR